jgi:hypothetical protein
MVSRVITRNTRLVADAFHAAPDRFSDLLQEVTPELMFLPPFGMRIHTDEDYLTVFSREILCGTLSDWILQPFVALSLEILQPPYSLDPSAVVVENRNPERVDAFLTAFAAAARDPVQNETGDENETGDRGNETEDEETNNDATGDEEIDNVHEAIDTVTG